MEKSSFLKSLITVFLLFIYAEVQAKSFEVDGINYSVVSNTSFVYVVSKEIGQYSGNVVIPRSISYEGNEYIVSWIGSHAFYNCSGLTSITIPSGLSSIGSFAFQNCIGLSSVTIEGSLVSIEDYVFSGCTGLTSITIPGTVISIGALAFYNCSGLTSVTIPSSVVSIGESAFWKCSGLTSVTIENGVNSIANSAFSGCIGLTSITIPSSVTYFGQSVFAGCRELTSVSIPNGVTTIGSDAFWGCQKLTSIIIPSNITSISGGVFENCIGLTSVTIPDGVTSINSGSFKNCSGLTSITIPSSVTSFGVGSFSNCRGLTSVTLLNPVPPAIQLYLDTYHPFYNIDFNNCKLYVPKGSKQRYTETAGWNMFYNIIELDGLGVTSAELKLTDAESGSFKYILTKGDSFKTIITPSAGWKINTVTFNGNDVTSELDANNQYITPAITSNSEIKVSYQSILLNVEQNKSASIKVHADAGSIVIKGADLGENIKIYTITGCQVKATTVSNEMLKVKLPAKQIYIVNIGKASYKVAL